MQGHQAAEATVNEFANRLASLLVEAESCGVVLEVRLQPNQPLRMGSFSMVPRGSGGVEKPSMSYTALDLAYARAQLAFARYRFTQIDCGWQVGAWEWRCRELAARLLDTGEPLLLF